MSFSVVFRALALGCGLLLSTYSAQAATFDATYSVPVYQSSQNYGTQIGISGISPLSFNLTNSGDTYGPVNLFDISVLEDINHTWWNPVTNDTVSNPIKVTFSFTQPANKTGTITGTTTGVLTHQWLSSSTSKLDVSWDGPITLDFGSGVNLAIALDPLTIRCGRDGCVTTTVTYEYEYVWNSNEHCYEWVKKIPIRTTTYANGEVQGQFEYFAAPTPLPAALPLFVSGLGAIGLLGWRRKRNYATS